MTDTLTKDATANDFVYVTYIATTPEKLWQALIDPAFTRRYFGPTFDSDWKVGSDIVWNHPGGEVFSGMKVLEAVEPKRLSMSWHVADKAWNVHHKLSPADLARAAAEPQSVATFEIEEVEAGKVKLTLVHSGFAADSLIRPMIGGGWPKVLSGLKTLLETGSEL